MDPDFEYTNSANTAKSNYLKDKWDKLYPGWNRKPQRVDAPQLILPANTKDDRK